MFGVSRFNLRFAERSLFPVPSTSGRQPRRAFLKQLESREVFASLLVLMVIADQQDFYYQEYGGTKLSLEEAREFVAQR